MDRDFTWNKSQAQLDYERAMAQAAAAGARNGAQEAFDADPNQYVSRDTMAAMPFPNMSEAYNDIVRQKMAQEADRAAKMARLKELEQIRNQRMQKIQGDPRFQMAAMMLMAGDSGMMNSLFAKDEGASAKQLQTDMDSLEDKMAYDIFALGDANDEQFDKIAGALIPLYKDRFGELEGKGARSRLGGWDAWEQAIRGAKNAFSSKKAKENEAKAKAEAQKRADKEGAKKLKG